MRNIEYLIRDRYWFLTELEERNAHLKHSKIPFDKIIAWQDALLKMADSIEDWAEDIDEMGCELREYLK
ncbi:MAG: hypothetical protein ACTSRC_22005 [Candidatus Helarchaeota archaeon]